MMQGKVAFGGFDPLVPADSSLRSARSVLIVEAQDVLGLLSPAPHRQSIVLTQKRMLTRQMLETVLPDAIVGPLITSAWDIVDLAIVLEDLGFTGDLYALTRPLPRAELVVREVGAVCPRLTVHLLEMG
jgi:hypothetical protein